MKDEKTENRVIVLHSMGWSIRRISREVDISRGRVRRWLVSNSVLRDTTSEAVIKQKKQHTSKLDPHKSYIGDLLEKYSDITGQRVYEHLKEKEFDGFKKDSDDFPWLESVSVEYEKRIAVTEINVIPISLIMTIIFLPVALIAAWNGMAIAPGRFVPVPVHSRGL